MNINSKKNKQFTISVGIGISTIILIPIICILIFVYSTLSASFKDTLVNYSLSLLQSMTTQGINIVEQELENNLMEVSLIAKNIDIEKDFEAQNEFLSKYQNEVECLRVLVFDKDGNSTLSNGEVEAIKDRADFVSIRGGGIIKRQSFLDHILILKMNL